MIKTTGKKTEGTSGSTRARFLLAACACTHTHAYAYIYIYIVLFFKCDLKYSVFYSLICLHPLTFTWKTSSLLPTLNWDSNRMVNFSSVTDSAPRLSDRLILFKDCMINDVQEQMVCINYAVRLISVTHSQYMHADYRDHMWIILGGLWRLLLTTLVTKRTSLKLQADPPKDYCSQF